MRAEVYDWKHLRALPAFARPNRLRIASDLASPGSQEPSAAQNGTVIQTCRQCGAAHGAESANCYVCHARLSPDDRSDRVRSNGVVRTDGALAVALDWRTEVTLRLQEYRKRQRRLREGPSQPELAFGDDMREAFAGPAVRAPAPPAPAVRLAPRRPRRVERVEIDLLQPS